MRLEALACPHAWADRVVQGAERALVKKLFAELALLPTGAAKVEGRLGLPPPRRS